MPAETLSERQNADSDPVINQLYAITEQPPTTSVIDVNELQIQKEHKETIKLLHELQDANSTLKCDTPLRSLNQFSKDRFRLLEPEAFPRSQVQPPFYPEYKLIADRSHIDSFRDVLPQQPVKVLIQAALPR